MTRLAAIDARHRLIEAVTVEFVERDLLDLGNFVESRWTELEGCVFHDPHPLIAFSRQFRELVLDLLAARLDFFYLLFELIASGESGLELFV